MSLDVLKQTDRMPTTEELEALLAAIQGAGPQVLRTKLAVANWFGDLITAGVYHTEGLTQPMPALRKDAENPTASSLQTMRAPDLSALMREVHALNAEAEPTSAPVVSKPAVTKPPASPAKPAATSAKPAATSASASPATTTAPSHDQPASNDGGGLAEFLAKYNAETESMLLSTSGFITRLDRIESQIGTISSRMDATEKHLGRIASILPQVANAVGSLEMIFGVDESERSVRLDSLFAEAAEMEANPPEISEGAGVYQETNEVIRGLYELAGLDPDTATAQECVSLALKDRPMGARMVEYLSAADVDISAKSVGNPAGVVAQFLSTFGRPGRLLS